MPLNVFTQIFCALLFYVISLSLSATQITITDNNNQPIENVVIAFKTKSNSVTSAPTELATMDQVDSQFLPKILVISQDQWVDFPNSDNIRHHVYSFSSPKPFEIKMFTGSEADPIQFTKPGIVVLGCNIHDSMVGFIYVSDQDLTRASNKLGKIELTVNDLAAIERDKNASSIISATLWHPQLSPANTKRIEVQLDTNLTEQVISLDFSQALLNKTKKTTGFASKFRKAN